jgi:hypothetical protein
MTDYSRVIYGLTHRLIQVSLVVQMFAKKHGNFFLKTFFSTLIKNCKSYFKGQPSIDILYYTLYVWKRNLFLFDIYIHPIIPSTTSLKNHHISISYYWKKGIRSTSLIHRETNIPLSIIYYNIEKLKQIDSLTHRDENDWACVFGGKEWKAIGQYIRYDNEK